MQFSLSIAKILLMAALFTAMSLPAQGQIEQRERFEKEQRFRDEDVNIISLKEAGIGLLQPLNKYKSGNRTWELTLLDTLLKETAIVSLEIDNQGNLIGYDYSPGYVHLLYSKNEIRGDMEIVTIELSSRTVTRHELIPQLKFQLTHFCKVGGNFVFGGYVDMEPAVLIYITESEKLKVIPGFFEKNTELVDVRPNKNETFNTVIFDRENRDSHKIVLRVFDSFGTQLLEDVIVTENFVLQTGISSSLERDDLIVLGTWGEQNSKKSSGFYALPIDPFSEQKVKRNYFGELDSYLDYLKPKQSTSVKEDTKKSVEQDKIPNFKNYVMPYKIIEHPHGFFLLAEAYVPTRNFNQYAGYNNPYSNYLYSYSPYGGYYPNQNYRNNNTDQREYGNNVSNEEEVKTVQTVVISFDATGKILSDYSIKLDDINRSSLSQVADFYQTNGAIHFLYKKEGDLRIKSINLLDQSFTESTQKIKLANSNDQWKSDEKEGIVQHWYGNNFFMWGYQQVRNPERGARDVFYINRVVVR